MNADQMAQRRIPRAIQYGAIQQMLFVMGIMLGMGVVTETGVFSDIASWFEANIHNIWLVGIGSGILSSLIDTFTVAVSDIMLYDVVAVGDMAVNGAYWEIIAYCTAVGGCLLCVGSTSGVALMKMEHVRLGWYLKNMTLKVCIGWSIGLAVLWMEINLI
jgi:Na+/H+ antiporter NhaD/arsenite permease-like protein